MEINNILYRDTVKNALLEDLGTGDITTLNTVPSDKEGEAFIVSKDSGIIAGAFVAIEAFNQIDDSLAVDIIKNDGEAVYNGDKILSIKGRLTSILFAERVALNFLQRLSGIATMSNKFVKEISGFNCRVVDTRKTTPGLRILEKYAVRAGGGHNHRFGLSDGVLIKDNHIAACGSVKDALLRLKPNIPHNLLIEIEISEIHDINVAIQYGANAILLDNFKPKELIDIVGYTRNIKKDIILEASGGITLKNVRVFAETGVDIISSGALTHSSKALDLSLNILF
jgi:nicotinate-nucleotide pyrophosphorylase (carboxylating)